MNAAAAGASSALAEDVEVSAALLAALELDAGPRQDVVPVAAEAAAADEAGSASADEMTCSICLQHTELEEIACVKGCDHTYCVKCILRWASHRETPTCPQCKAPFDYLFTYYRLDGSLNDFPCEESVCLLKRARFFTDHMQVVEKGSWRLSAEDGSSEWRDYEPFYQEYDDDEAVEDYYFSPAAGRARIVLGNRRFGENGYVASGRSYARPARTPNAQNKTKGGGKPPAAAAAATPPSGGGSGGRRRRNRGNRGGAAAAGGTGDHNGNELPSSACAAAAASPASAAGGIGGGAAAASGARSASPATTARAASQPIPMRGHAAAASSPQEDDDDTALSAAQSPPLGCSPGSSSCTPGTGRRARRSSRRVFEDSMAALADAPRT